MEELLQDYMLYELWRSEQRKWHVFIRNRYPWMEARMHAPSSRCSTLSLTHSCITLISGSTNCWYPEMHEIIISVHCFHFFLEKTALVWNYYLRPLLSFLLAKTAHCFSKPLLRTVSFPNQLEIHQSTMLTKHSRCSLWNMYFRCVGSFQSTNLNHWFMGLFLDFFFLRHPFFWNTFFLDSLPDMVFSWIVTLYVYVVNLPFVVDFNFYTFVIVLYYLYLWNLAYIIFI